MPCCRAQQDPASTTSASALADTTSLSSRSGYAAVGPRLLPDPENACGRGGSWLAPCPLSQPDSQSALEQELPSGGDHRFARLLGGLDDLGVIDATQVFGCVREVGVPGLSLDHDQRDSRVWHLDSVRVPGLVRREPPADACCERCVVRFCAGERRRAWPAACRVVDDAELPSDGQAFARGLPWFEV
jgi:hypothetical protein